MQKKIIFRIEKVFIIMSRNYLQILYLTFMDILSSKISIETKPYNLSFNYID